MYSPIKISQFLHRKKEKVSIISNSEYSLVTVRLHHKGVVVREKKKGSLLGSNMYRISKGQFILSAIDARNGAFGIVPDELDEAIITNDFWTFDVDEKVVKKDFFYWFTNTPIFLEACQKSSKGETQRIRLQKDLFFNIEFHFPPIDKQEIFLRKLNIIDLTLNSLRNEQDNQSLYLSQLRQSILQEAIEGKLTKDWRKNHPVKKGDPETDANALLEKIKAEKENLIAEGAIRKEKPLTPIKPEEVPFELPKGWVWTTLDKIGFTQTGTTPSTTNKENFGNFIPFIKPADISSKGIDYNNEGLSEKGSRLGRIIAKDSILMVCIGGSIGKSFYTVRDVTCNQQINTISPVNGINTRFLFFFLKSKYFQTQLWSRAMKSSTPIINKGKWQSIPVPFLALSEQRAIVERVDNLLSMVDDLEKQVTTRKEHAEALMQAVLREGMGGNDK